MLLNETSSYVISAICSQDMCLPISTQSENLSHNDGSKTLVDFIESA